MRLRLPGTDLDLFPLCLGGNVFGWSADQDASFAVLDAYVAAGGNVIDTADAYAAWLGNGGGESETIIGAWMRERGNRDDLVIATKVGKRPGFADLRPETIRAAAEESLTRLGTDRIDLYYAHQDHDDDMPAALEAFDGLVRAGKVRHLAASNYPRDRLAQALDLQAEHGWSPYVALQPEYNLLAREDYETQYAELCVARGLGTLPYFGLARGYLTGKYRADGAQVDSVRAAGASAFVGRARRARARRPRRGGVGPRRAPGGGGAGLVAYPARGRGPDRERAHARAARRAVAHGEPRARRGRGGAARDGVLVMSPSPAVAVPGQFPLEGTSRTLVLGALAVGAVVDIAYWVLWAFARDVVASDTTSSYYEFEDAFPLADLWLLICLVGAATALVRRHHSALFWLLVGGGAGIYLGCMDLLYDLQHATFGKGGGGVIELAIVTMTFVFGVSLLRWGWRRRHTILALESGHQS